MLRKIIVNVHTYGGLLCFSYLILLGISVLNFNHRYAFTLSPGSVTTWTQPMTLPELARIDGKAGADALQMRGDNNQMILHALGSFAARSPNPDGSWTGPDTYHAHFLRPGKEYQIDVHAGQRSATITQTRTNFWHLVRDLHGSHITYPDSILAGTWAWYTDLCTCVVVAAGISGVYLWTRRRRERRIGLILIGSAAALCLALMLLITFQE